MKSNDIEHLLFFAVFAAVLCVGCGHVPVRVESQPGGATVYSRGRNFGTTPATLDLLRGRTYSLTVAKEGCRDYRGPISTKTPSPLVVSLECRPPPPPPRELVSLLPGDTTFVVLPFNDSLIQQEYAATVEKHLVGAGLRVVHTPQKLRDVEQRTEVRVAAKPEEPRTAETPALRFDQQATSTARYEEFEPNSAHYRVDVMLTGPGFGTVRFTRSSDGQILGVFDVDAGRPGETQLSSALERMKFVGPARSGS